MQEAILITEDNRLIGQDLKEILEEVGYTNVFYSKDVNDAISILEKKTIQLVLLDINLNSDLTGIDLANHINEKYKIPFIFTTSYSDIDTIAEVKLTNPAGYIIKPYSRELLLATVEIVLFKYSKERKQKKKTEKTIATIDKKDFVINNHLSIKNNGMVIKIPFSEIVWFESDKNYVEINTTDKKYLIRTSLKQILEKLPDNYFVKCHKQYIVNILHIEGIKADEIEIQSQRIPMIRNLKPAVMDLLNS